MTPSFFRDATRLAVLTLALGAWACSSGDAEQSIPGAASGTGGSSMSGSGGTAGGSSGSGGTAVTCPGDDTNGAGAAGATGDESATTSGLPWLHTEGTELKDPEGNTVILRGVDLIDLAATDQWEGGIKKMIDRLTDPDDTQGSSPGWGTKILRLAVAPADSGIGSPAAYAPCTNYYERYLRPTVDYAAEKGLYVIIDWHYIDTTSDHTATTTAFWSDVAPRFAHDSNVFFELYNEPTDNGQWSTGTKPNMQAWYNLVRQSAPDNVILVGTPNWCQQVGDAARDPLDGTNIMYVAHMYPQHWKSQGLRDQITQAAGLVPVFVSEWGFEETAMDTLLQGTITTYGDPFKAFLTERQVSWSAWCASASWAPPMFARDYTLRVGEGEMGGFVKDWLWDERDNDQPAH